VSERITEAELRDEERGTIHHNVMGTPIEGLSRECLVAEVRRLRGLIAESAETVNLALICADPPRDVSGHALVEAGREFAGRLLAEARAIREEQGEKLCACVPSFEGFDGRCLNCREERG
jgi:hypothetical protein